MSPDHTSRTTTTPSSSSSTLYLSGFPEDWKEREMSNIFLFAKGFLGSTVKNGCQSSSLCSSDNLLVPSLSAGKTSAAVTCAGLFTPPSSGNVSPTLADIVKGKVAATQQEQPPLKGPIGFALFATPEDALEASKVLENCSLDPLQPSLKVKVQMAKKNLHLPLTSCAAAAAVITSTEQRQRSKSFSGNLPGIDGDELVALINRATINTTPEPQLYSPLQNTSTKSSLKRRFSVCGSTGSDSLSSFLENSSCQARQTFRSMSLSIPGTEEPVIVGFGDSGLGDVFNNTSNATTTTNNNTQSKQTTNYLAFPDPVDPMFLDELETIPSLQVGGRTSVQSSPKLSASSVSAPSFVPSLASSFAIGTSSAVLAATATNNANNVLNTNSNQNYTAPLMVSRGGQVFSPENPPCNTLYVGNLPLFANEQELRSLFGAAVGFKRMNFKLKNASSPMCFVEFDDIHSATVAMEGMYGSLLSNSTKGGIRLSYSKNPLGVKPPAASSSLSVSAVAQQQQEQQQHQQKAILFSKCSDEHKILNRSYRSSSMSSLQSSSSSLPSLSFPPFSKYTNQYFYQQHQFNPHCHHNEMRSTTTTTATGGTNSITGCSSLW